VSTTKREETNKNAKQKQLQHLNNQPKKNN